MAGADVALAGVAGCAGCADAAEATGSAGCLLSMREYLTVLHRPHAGPTLPPAPASAPGEVAERLNAPQSSRWVSGPLTWCWRSRLSNLPRPDPGRDRRLPLE